VPGISSAEELSDLPHAELAVQLAEACRVIADRAAVIEQLRQRVEHLERRTARDSPNSSKPPSSDSPYEKDKKKEPRDRSLRDKGQTPPGQAAGRAGHHDEAGG
jgi:hypothetical protein